MKKRILYLLLAVIIGCGVIMSVSASETVSASENYEPLRHAEDCVCGYDHEWINNADISELMPPVYPVYAHAIDCVCGYNHALLNNKVEAAASQAEEGPVYPCQSCGFGNAFVVYEYTSWMTTGN